jgi:hypothetical protein
VALVPEQPRYDGFPEIFYGRRGSCLARKNKARDLNLAADSGGCLIMESHDNSTVVFCHDGAKG